MTPDVAKHVRKGDVVADRSNLRGGPLTFRVVEVHHFTVNGGSHTRIGGTVLTSSGASVYEPGEWVSYHARHLVVVRQRPEKRQEIEELIQTVQSLHNLTDDYDKERKASGAA